MGRVATRSSKRKRLTDGGRGDNRILVKEFLEVAETFSIEVVDRDEAEGGGVDAVAEVSGCWAVREDVAEVGVGLLGTDFGADHAVAGVGQFDDGLRINGAEEAGPAGAGIEFVGGAEEGLARDDVDVDARFFVVPVGVAKGRFGPAFAGDVVLEGGEASLGIVHDGEG